MPISSRVVIFFLTFTFISEAFSYNTYPNSRRKYKHDPLRVSLSGEIPINYEDYAFTTIIDGKSSQKGETRIPAFYRDSFGNTSVIGTIPEGLQVKFEKFGRYNHQHIYKIPIPQGFEGKKNSKKTWDFVWILGSNLKATAYNGK